MRSILLLAVFLFLGLGDCAVSPPSPSDTDRQRFLDLTAKAVNNRQLRFHQDVELSQADYEVFQSMAIGSHEDLAQRLDRYPFANPQCQADVDAYVSHLKNVTKGNLDIPFWAIKMFDATGKIPDGVLSGNVVALGSYTSCLEIEGAVNPSVPFVGAYSLVNIPILGMTWTMNFGVCLPSSCNLTDFYVAVVNNWPKNRKFTAFLTPVQTKNDVYEWDNVSYAFTTFVSVLAIISILATAMDFALRQELLGNNQDLAFWKKVVLAFSIYTNTGKLLTVMEPTKDHLSCLDGIRFLSITWVMMGHFWGQFGNMMKVNNFTKMGGMTLSNFSFQAIDNAFFSVDTFFTLSACLVTYLTMKELDKTRGRINVPLFYIHRYLRLTGVYAFVVFFQASLSTAFSYGPGNYMKYLAQGCKDHYYRNLGYFSIYDFNHTTGTDMLSCLGQTWYLDNDMQMFIVSLLLIYPMWRLGKAGLIFTVLMTLASVITQTVLTATRDWPATLTLGDRNGFFIDNYIKPWNRFAPYGVGILLGYLLHVTKNKEIKIPRFVNLAMWLIAFGIGIAVVYGLNIPSRLNPAAENYRALSDAEEVTYGGFSRLAWAIALSWVIFACCRGYGGFVNQLLSWEAFQPLSRVSYIMYLVHITIFQILGMAMTFEITYSHFTAVVYFLSATVMVVVVSGIVFVGVELPWLTLEKLLVGKLLSMTKRS